MKIGILETGEVHPDLIGRHGDYPGMFRDLLSAADPTLEFETVHVVAGEMPAGPTAADAWLVTGSRHGVYDDLPWIAPLRDFLRAAVAARVPVVGICFGHQILAEALGGRVVKSDRGWGVGVQDYDLTARPSWLGALPDHFAVNAMHQDQVIALPESATVLARSAHCDYAALAYGDPESPDAISLQPHPEFGAGFMDDLIALRTGAVFSEDDARAARSSLSRPVDSGLWARTIVDFLHRAAERRSPARPA